MNPSAFNSKQLQELQEPLSSQAVRTRNQSGRNLSYIEGWYAISEANRIFGFDSWDQEIVELKCVSERERKIGRDQKPGWGISYVASIRITVNGIKREGVGAGHGIDVDPGQAHESAIKEAATDAMKRALMTFGNQFGLALYDKEQRNVEDKPLNLEQVSESDKTAKKFVDVLLAKMEQAGINSDGIKTLKAILQLTEFEDVKESLRPKLLERLTPEYAAKLNIGQNAKGDQVIQIVAKEIAQSTADLQKAASEALA
jgi:DNA recombination protein Rad52